jgi:hypothetical protein
MAKRQKDRQDNGQKTEGQTRPWLKDRRTDKTMAKRQKDRQDHGQKTEGQKDEQQSKTLHRKLKIEQLLKGKQFLFHWRNPSC